MEETPFPLIVVEGDPRERGIAYGEQAQEQIRRSLTFYSESVTPALGISFGDVCDQVIDRLPAWRALDDEVITEVEGIAAGSGQEVAEILALNSRGAFVRPPADQQRDAAAPPDGCTSWVVLPGASADGHMWTGQNWDYLAGIQDTIVLVHIRPDRGPRQLMIVEAGQIGRHGANDAGIALHANGLSSRLRNPDALPSPLWRRRILRQSNMTSALDAVIRPPRAASTNILLSHRDGFAIDVETQPQTSRWLYPDDGWLLHTNHYLAEVPHELASTYTPSADSLVRYGRGRQILSTAAHAGGIGFEDLASVARDHFADGRGCCSHPELAAPAHERWQTVATVITDLTDGVMAVAAGPPCNSEFSRVRISSGEVLSTSSPALAAT